MAWCVSRIVVLVAKARGGAAGGSTGHAVLDAARRDG
jgi:hypothetical protein